jgi:peptidoglycan/xylan/chitin deacetylase (PgdA/CDA1 family)
MAGDLHRAAIRHFSARTLRLNRHTRYISFSFDDCALSATTTGRAILEDASVRATFYLAGGLANTRDSSPVCFESKAVPELRAMGHEIACHTHDHVALDGLSPGEITAQIELNRKWLSGVLPGYQLESFSYPFGAVSLAAKRVVGRHYQSARSTFEGINSGSVDLLLLRATRVYERLGNLPQLLSLIDTVRDSGGWLIFYTHDVAERPSPFGCTPELFRNVVNASVASGCPVLPVRDVLESIAG